MSVHFGSVWVLALWPFVLAYLVWATRRSYVSLSPGRKRLSLILRILFCSVAVLAGARPVARLPLGAAPTAVLVDVSSSISDAQLAAARAAVARLPLGNDTQVVSFAGRAKVESAGPGGPKLERHDAGETRLGEAISLARRLFVGRPPHFVILTDGHDTSGGAREAIAEARADGSEFTWLAPTGEPLHDVAITELRAPEVLRQDEPTKLSAVVRATRATRGTLRLYENNLVIAELPDLALAAGPQTFDLPVQPTASGMVRYMAEIDARDDEVADDNQMAQLLKVSGAPRVLIVTNDRDESAHLEETLSLQSFSVETVGVASLPATVEGLLGYDAVLVVGVSPFEIDRLRQTALVSYVRDASGGLLWVSGRNGLRRDPMAGTHPIEQALPVETAATSERQEAPLGLVLVIDRSGSMTGEKLDYAKQAALAVIDKLSPYDQLGVIAFDARFDWVLPLVHATDKARLRTAVGSLGAGGGTKFYPALEDAYYSLGASDATVRHIILLTDGVSTDPNIFPALLDKMRAHAVTVSTVAIGHDADVKLLTQIAHLGGGRFTIAEDARSVPDIFVKETQVAQNDAAQRQDTGVRVVTPARELAGIDFASAPPLSGYIRTKGRTGAEVLLETTRPDPLLVRWRVGLGQVAVFTSDATTLWSKAWLSGSWPGFARMWSQLVRGLRPSRPHEELRAQLQVRGDVLRMTVDAVDAAGRFLDDLEVRASVIDGAHETHELALRQIGPGRYFAELRVPPGSVLGRPLATRAGRRIEGSWAFLARTGSRELGNLDVDELSPLVAASHGRLATDLVEARRGGPVGRVAPLTVYLALLALLLFLLDLAAKRVRWERRL